jgi:hypothetical protein
MSIHIPAESFAEVARKTVKPNLRQNVDRSFGLPTGLYVATIGAYFAFLAVMGIGLAQRELIIPMGICFAYVAMFFGVPAKWVRMNPANDARPQSWLDYQLHGVETWSGRIKAKDATAQVLILPILILFWGVATVIIATQVS